MFWPLIPPHPFLILSQSPRAAAPTLTMPIAKHSTPYNIGLLLSQRLAAVVWCNQRFGVSLHQIISLLRIINWRFGGMDRDRARPLNNNQCFFILGKQNKTGLNVCILCFTWDLISLLGLKSCSFQTSSPSGWSSSKLRLQISLRPPSPPPHHWQSGPDGVFQLWYR